MVNKRNQLKDISDIEAYFEPIASALTAFSKIHNLLSEKYYHDGPLWSLCFNHPAGGQAKLDVAPESDKYVTIQALWWQDDYHSFTRSTRYTEKQKVIRHPQNVTHFLDEALRSMLRWQPGNWTNVAGGYERIWGRYSQTEFDAMLPNWPIPK